MSEALVVLEGAEVAAYLDRLRSLVRAARLSQAYYPAAVLLELLDWLHPEAHGGVYDSLKLDGRSGLPILRELLRPATDRQAAAAELQRPGGPGKKRRYYERLVEKPVSALENAQVVVRREDEDGRLVRLVVDKLDARGWLSRMSVLASDADGKRQAAELLEAVQRVGPFDAEWALVHLTDKLGLAVESVVRGVIGPLWFRGVRVPDEVAALVAGGGAILSCASEEAGVTVPAGGNNDPFVSLFEEEIGEEARATYHAVQDRLGYRVYRDRKFAVSPGLEGALGELCAARGARSVIYSAE